MIVKLRPQADRTSLSELRRWLGDRDVVFALALSFAVGVAVWFGRAIEDFFAPSGATILVPSLIGQTETDAIGLGETVHLKLVVVSRAISDQFPRDVVMGQQPVAGTRVREGRQVSLIVSRGVNIYTMPDLRFASLRDAGLMLSRLKLNLGTTSMAANDDVPFNHVVSQDPAPLSSVREGTTVNLVLSKGPPSFVRAPDFVGLQIGAARDVAGRARVHLGQVVWTPFGPKGPPRGVIVRQLPGPGILSDPLEPVSLQVSAGPGEYGYLVRQVHVDVVLPNDETGASVRVRIRVRDDTGTWNVFDGFGTPGQRLDFDLTVIGTSWLDVYLNNELQSQTQLGKEAPRPSPSPARRNR